MASTGWDGRSVSRLAVCVSPTLLQKVARPAIPILVPLLIHLVDRVLRRICVAVNTASFCRHTSSAILSNRYRFQVIGPHARWIPTQVVNLQAVTNRSDKELVGPPVSDHLLAVHSELAVTGRLRAPDPLPAAIVALFDLLPKPHFGTWPRTHTANHTRKG